MSYIHKDFFDTVTKMIATKRYQDAIQITNQYLKDDPNNKDLLITISQIHYLIGDYDKSSKPVDFMLHQDPNNPMYWYIKWCIEYKKSNRQDAKNHLKQALKMTWFANLEVMRMYALAEFYYGNQEKWLELVRYVFDSWSRYKHDPEIITDLISIYTTIGKPIKAKSMIEYYNKHHDKMYCIDKDIMYYDDIINKLNSKIVTTK